MIDLKKKFKFLKFRGGGLQPFQPPYISVWKELVPKETDSLNGFINKERFNERIPFLVKRPRNEANSISEGNKSTVFLVHFLANVSVLFTSRYRRAATKIDSVSEIEVLNARQNPKANAHVRYEIS